MMQMIRYCKQRWGSTLYYVDSCVSNDPKLRETDVNELLGSDYFKRINEEMPDVLVMPENQSANCFPSTAPYDEGGHHGVRRTPRRVKAQWPGAFTAINISGPRDPKPEDFLEALRSGDLLLYQQWEPLQKAVREAYDLAGRPPTARLVTPKHGAIVKPGEPIVFEAVAEDPDGKVKRVEFYLHTIENGKTRLGETTRPPYQWTWQNPQPGRCVLTARSLDDAGLECWSASAIVTVEK
jgi:hypothetical protein